MACGKWEEIGLLYESGELSPSELSQFGLHMETCSECRAEHDLYQREHVTLFTPDMLGEETPSALDAKILTACGKVHTHLVGFRIFSLIPAKAVIAGAFLFLGVIAGTYIAYNMDTARRLASQNAHPKTPSPATIATTTDSASRERSAPMAVRTDESKGARPRNVDRDSTVIPDSSPFPVSRSMAAGSGIVKVDLNK